VDADGRFQRHVSHKTGGANRRVDRKGMAKAFHSEPHLIIRSRCAFDVTASDGAQYAEGRGGRYRVPQAFGRL